ncbi:MAG: Crp/Fnr family transcriptional regulator [Hydrogenophaga sp.]|nr:Crp/Fnr family transcriptional regulator [Hydrogenophaga sp.]
MEEHPAALSPFGVKTVGFTAQHLTEDARALLRQKGVVRRYRRGEEVLQRHLVPTSAAWLLEGRLRCVGLQADGTELHCGWFMPQDVFAVDNVLLSQKARLTALVDTAEAQVLHFSREVLSDILMNMPEAGIAMSVGLSRRMQQLYDIIDVIGQRDLTDRLRALLACWATHHGIAAVDGSVELWVVQSELAVGAGASRQRVHMELQQLRDQGEIELGYRKVILRPAFFRKMQDLPPPR